MYSILTMDSIINYLKNKQLIWQADHKLPIANLNSTGFSELDSELQGGFPQQGVMDIDSPMGIGEIRLLLPNLLVRQQAAEKLLVFIAPPTQLNGEMLAEYGFALQHILILQPSSAQHALWSAEQCLKSGCCDAVLLWHQDLEIHHVKRLQLAAQQGDALQILLRQNRQISVSLPVTLGMKLRAHPQGLKIQVTKCKGRWPSQPFTLSMRQSWPALTVHPQPANILPFPQSKVS
jgi:cell division inhibitor SulA